jgi:gluconate kinase
VFLEVDEATATARSVARKAADPSQPGPGIVPGQFAALERPGPPEPALTIPVGGSSDEVVRLLRRAKFLDQR